MVILVRCDPASVAQTRAVSICQIATCIRSQAGTLVWTNGMDRWRPMALLFPGSVRDLSDSSTCPNISPSTNPLEGFLNRLLGQV